MAHRILFVDDERDIVDCARLLLENAGYEFEGVYDGVEAIQAVSRKRPDLIVLDVMMPRLSGFDTLTVLQNDPETENIPVIMLTARTQDRDITEAWKRGCTFFQPKPFDAEKLMFLIERILAGEA